MSITPSIRHLIGRVVTVEASLTRVKAFCDGQMVADHQRCVRLHQTVTDPAHVAQSAKLRALYQDAVRRQTTRHLILVEDRDLACYDQLWQQEAS